MKRFGLFAIIGVTIFLLLLLKHKSNIKKNRVVQSEWLKPTIQAITEEHLLTNYTFPVKEDIISILERDFPNELKYLKLYTKTDRNVLKVYDKGYDLLCLESEKYKAENKYLFSDLFINKDIEIYSFKLDSTQYKKFEGLNAYRNGVLIRDSTSYKLHSEVLRFVFQYISDKYELDSIDLIRSYPEMQKESIIVKSVYENKSYKQEVIYSDLFADDYELFLDSIKYIINKYKYDSVKMAVKIYKPTLAKHRISTE